MSAAKARWRRNWPWLIALPFLLALALLASSQRMIGNHLKWHPTYAQRAAGGVVMFHETFNWFGEDFTREARLRVATVERVDSYEENSNTIKPVPGMQLWRISLDITATPEQPLTTCEVRVFSGGVEYGPGAGKVSKTFEGPAHSTTRCTPLEHPGASLGLFQPTLEGIDPDRPGQWSSDHYFALPEGIEPEEFRVWWQPPNYASFPLSIS